MPVAIRLAITALPPFLPTQTLFRWPPMGVKGGNCPRSRWRGSVSPIRAKAFSDGAFSPIAVPHQTRRTRLFPLLIVSPPLAPPPLRPAVPPHTHLSRRPVGRRKLLAPRQSRSPPQTEEDRGVKEEERRVKRRRGRTSGRQKVGGEERRRKWESL